MKIETTPPMWYAILLCDLLLIYQNNDYLLHFDLSDSLFEIKIIKL